MTQQIEQLPFVLVVEDETDLRDAVVSYLLLDGFNATSASSLQQAQARLAEQHFDVILLDLGLPDGDGLDWLRQCKELETTGLIITTARGAKVHRLDGIRCGADAYLVKPLDLEELSLQVLNLTRRVRRPNEGSWILDTTQWSLLTPKRVTVMLTRNEMQFLLPLIQSSGAPVDRENLITSMGHKTDYYDTRRMEIMVRRLRKKIEAHGGEPLPLKTIYGYGYAFSAKGFVEPLC